VLLVHRRRYLRVAHGVHDHAPAATSRDGGLRR
jgi:hypothetical protein